MRTGSKLGDLRKDTMACTSLAVVAWLCIMAHVHTVSCESVNPNWVEEYRSTLDAAGQAAIQEHMERYETLMKDDDPSDSIGTKDHLLPGCTPFQDSKIPESVHELTPADINVVAALGDAFTVGSGVVARNLTEIVLDAPESSWITGAQEPYQRTIANFVRYFNPDVKGLSYSNTRGLNVAAAGSTAVNLPTQTRALIDQMKKDSSIDIARDWKLITIYMGRNDLCFLCKDTQTLSADQYVGNLLASLDTISGELKRTFVNVVVPPLMEMWAGADDSSSISQTLHDVMCPCLVEARDGDTWDNMVTLHRELVLKVKKAMVEFNGTSDDFTMVYQPCFANTTLPKRQNGDVDYTYFSPDYYHFNIKGQEAMATALWNDLFQPVLKKESGIPYNTQPFCPIKREYMTTRWNSMDDRPIEEEEEPSQSWASTELIVGVVVSVIVFAGAVAVAMAIMAMQNARDKRRESIKPVIYQDQLSPGEHKDNEGYTAEIC